MNPRDIAGTGDGVEPGAASEHEKHEREAYANAMAELIVHVAHEVNQPLAAIAANGNACMRWLSANPPNIPEARAAAERIVRDARRASDVIGEMRAFLSRSGGPWEAVSLAVLLEDAVGSVAQQAQRHQVELHPQPVAGVPTVYGRRLALRQALVHLLCNAIEACEDMPPTLRMVSVRVRPPERGEIAIVVEDTGPGFPADLPQRLFEPLFTTKPGRLGLGLAVTRSIMEEHGGRLQAQRGSDGLTRFTATLPVEAKAP